MGGDEPRPPVDDVDSTFETVGAPATTDAGDVLCRGTHQYDEATVERTYHLTGEGLLVAETAYLDGEATVETVDECWLLADGTHLEHTGEPVVEFCRAHHFAEPATDLGFCRTVAEEVSDDEPEDVTSTFQPATEIEIEEGAVLRFTGSHETDAGRVERSFFVDETHEQLRVRTVFHWRGERLGSLTERQTLIDDGAFVEATGEPVDAFCRRTHLVDPAADLRYCRRLGQGSIAGQPPERE